MNLSNPSITPRGEIPTRARFMLSAWLAGAAAIAYLCRASLGIAESTIRDSLPITEDQMGLILGPLFFWSYALAQIPGGWLGERFGSRKCLPLFAGIWSVAIAISGFAMGVVLLGIGRIASGVAQAGLFPCAIDSVSRWHPPTERALVSGILAAAMQLGAILAMLLTGFLLRHLGWCVATIVSVIPIFAWPTGFVLSVLLTVMSWRVVFVAYALPGLIWAAGFFWWFRDRIEDHPSANAAEVALARGSRDAPRESSAVEPVPWARLASSSSMWMLCGQQFFRAAAAVWFVSWFPTYLQESRGVTRAASGILTALPLLTMMVAALCSGGLSDWMLRRSGSYALARKGVSIISLLICSCLTFLAYFISDATLATITIAAGAFFAACAGPCAYATSIDMGGRHVASVFATMNMIGNLGAGLLPYIVPQFRQWVERTPSLMVMAGGNSWNSVLVLFCVMPILAAACWMMLRMEGTVFDRNATTSRNNDG